MNYFQFILLCLSFTNVIANTEVSSPRSLSFYAIATQRSPQITQFCSQVDRNKLYQKYSQSQSIQYESDIKMFFSLDKTLFNQFLNLDMSGMNNTLKQSVGGYILFVVLPLIGLGLLLVSGFVCYVLLFCPFECCLRKKLIYSNFQQFCPVILLTIFSLTALGCCVTVLLSDYKIYGGYQELSCGSMVIFDDLLNGNIKIDHSSFFSGTKTIAQQMSLFNLQSSNIYDSLRSVSSNSTVISDSLSFMESVKTNISMISDSNKSNIVLQYNTPLMQSTHNSTITSIFPTILGNQSDDQSLIGVSYNAINQTQSRVRIIRDTVDSFIMTKDQSTNASNSIIQFMNQSSLSLNESLLTLNDMFTRYSFGIFQYSQILVYGLTTLLLLLLLVAQLFFLGYKRMCCRHFIYIFSLFIFFIAAALFILSLGFGFAAPVAYSGTNYFNQTLKNQTAFVNLLQKFGLSAAMGNAISVCLSQGNRDIIAAVGSSQTSAFVNQLKNVMNNLTTFDSKALSSAINNTYSNLQTNLISYSNSNILDINDTTAIKQLIYVSKSANFDCKEGNFQHDSWVPNDLQKGGLVACQTQFTIYADNNTCPSSDKFVTAAEGCTGCMSTSSLLYQFNSSTSVADYLGRRYTDCPIFNADLANIWANYYLVKINVLTPVINRADANQFSIGQLQNKLNTNLNPLISSTVTKLYNSAQTVLNPETGVIGGLNCGVIGEDVAIFTFALYKNTFSYSFYQLIYLSSISWCLLLVVWCNTCVVFRKKKDILNAINYPDDDNNMVGAAPLSDDRLFHIQL